LSDTLFKLPIVVFREFFKIKTICGKPFFQNVSINLKLVYPTKKREVAWTLREMGSTWEGGMGEGPALLAGSKISSSSAAEEGATLLWSNQEVWKKSLA
jgi:hypothetical protein